MSSHHSRSGCSCNRLVLHLDFVDFDPATDSIRWVYALNDDRLPEWRYVHVATDRSGWPLSYAHTSIDGICWDETDELQEGLPLDDPELRERLRSAIQAALAPVDLCRLLMWHYPPRERNASARRQRAA